MDTYNLIKYKIWKLLNLYNDMNQIFIQYNIKKLKTIILIKIIIDILNIIIYVIEDTFIKIN